MTLPSLIKAHKFDLDRPYYCFYFSIVDIALVNERRVIWPITHQDAY